MLSMTGSIEEKVDNDITLLIGSLAAAQSGETIGAMYILLAKLQYLKI